MTEKSTSKSSKHFISYRILCYATAKEKVQLSEFRGQIAEISKRTGIDAHPLDAFARELIRDALEGALKGRYDLNPRTVAEEAIAYTLLIDKFADHRFRFNSLMGKIGNLVPLIDVEREQLTAFAAKFLLDTAIKMLAGSDKEKEDRLYQTIAATLPPKAIEVAKNNMVETR